LLLSKNGGRKSHQNHKHTKTSSHYYLIAIVKLAIRFHQPKIQVLNQCCNVFK
jgi:hypothetical protein